MLAWVMNLGFAAGGVILLQEIGKPIKKRFQFGDLFSEISTNVILIDPVSLDPAVGATIISTTFTGSALGDIVMFSAPYDLQDITATAYVSGVNTISIRLQNEGGATVDLASAKWKFIVLKPNI